MATYRIGLHYDAYAYADIEGEDENDVIEKAFSNLDWFEFEGDYDIIEVEKVEE